MGAQQLNINDYKPYLSEESIQAIVKQAVEMLDGYNREYFSDEIHCSNGFMIEIQARYDGFNYRRIRISYLQVHLLENSTWVSDNDCEMYANKISDLLHDAIYDLNDKSEQEYESRCELTY